MPGKTISQSELTLYPSLKKRGTNVHLLLVSRISRQRRGEGLGDEFLNIKKRNLMIGRMTQVHRTHPKSLS